MTPKNPKRFVLEFLTDKRAREVSERIGFPVTNGTWGVKAIARVLSRKRKVTVEQVLGELNREELALICKHIGVGAVGDEKAIRGKLREPLESGDFLKLHTKQRRRKLPLVAMEVTLHDVQDGDTLSVQLPGCEKPTYVRVRGIDTPEMHTSDKAEADLDRSDLAIAEARPLGLRAKARAMELLAGKKVFLHLEPLPLAEGKFRNHRGRILAYVSIGSSDGPDLGEILLREGYALVWPRELPIPRFMHAKRQQYVFLCNEALHKKPGLWNEGMKKLCPAIQRGMETWTVKACNINCCMYDIPKKAAAPASSEAEQASKPASPAPQTAAPNHQP